MLWAVNPPMTAALCIVKGVLAGYAAGLVYKALNKLNHFLGVICAAVVCPVVNTGIFICAMIFLYRETLSIWAGDTHFLYFAFIGMAGINFVLELAVNVVLCPAVSRIIKNVTI